MFDRDLINHIWDNDDDDWDDIFEDDDFNYDLDYCEECGSHRCSICGEMTCFGCACDREDTKEEDDIDVD